jgi:hypothetical protein
VRTLAAGAKGISTKLCAVAAGMRPLLMGSSSKGRFPWWSSLFITGVPAYDADSEAAQVGAGGFGFALSTRAFIMGIVLALPAVGSEDACADDRVC